jgi:hypothetical protein
MDGDDAADTDLLAELEDLGISGGNSPPSGNCLLFETRAESEADKVVVRVEVPLEVWVLMLVVVGVDSWELEGEGWLLIIEDTDLELVLDPVLLGDALWVLDSLCDLDPVSLGDLDGVCEGGGVFDPVEDLLGDLLWVADLVEVLLGVALEVGLLVSCGVLEPILVLELELECVFEIVGVLLGDSLLGPEILIDDFVVVIEPDWLTALPLGVIDGESEIDWELDTMVDSVEDWLTEGDSNALGEEVTLSLTEFELETVGEILWVNDTLLLLLGVSETVVDSLSVLDGVSVTVLLGLPEVPNDTDSDTLALLLFDIVLLSDIEALFDGLIDSDTLADGEKLIELVEVWLGDSDRDPDTDADGWGVWERVCVVLIVGDLVRDWESVTVWLGLMVLDKLIELLGDSVPLIELVTVAETLLDSLTDTVALIDEEALAKQSPGQNTYVSNISQTPLLLHKAQSTGHEAGFS